MKTKFYFSSESSHFGFILENDTKLSGCRKMWVRDLRC